MPKVWLVIGATYKGVSKVRGAFGSRDDSKAAALLKSHLSMATAHDSCSPEDLCTMGRQFGPLESILISNGLLCV